MRRVCDHVLLMPCGEHTVFIEIWKWVTARGKKKKRKTHNLHRARAKPRGDEEQSGRGRVTGDTRPQSINLDYRPKDCVADDASDAYALFSPSSYF